MEMKYLRGTVYFYASCHNIHIVIVICINILMIKPCHRIYFFQDLFDMRQKTELWKTIIVLIINFAAGQDLNLPHSTPNSPNNYDTAYNNPSSTPNTNLDVNPYNPYSTPDSRYGTFDQNGQNDPYGQNNPYNKQDPYGSIGKQDPYGDRNQNEYGQFDNNQFGNRGRTPWKNNIFGGDRSQFDVHSSIIRDA